MHSLHVLPEHTKVCALFMTMKLLLSVNVFGDRDLNSLPQSDGVDSPNPEEDVTV